MKHLYNWIVIIESVALIRGDASRLQLQKPPETHKTFKKKAILNTTI